MHKRIGFWCCLTAIVLLTACGHKSIVVLVPDPDGTVGQVTVSNEAGLVNMDRANQSSVIRSENTSPGAPTQMDPDKVEDMFAEVISNQPPLPVHFILYFKSDSVQLLQASIQQLPEIITVIQQRMPTRISVVGHSDTMGDKAYNLDLSMRRAQDIKQKLSEKGVDTDLIYVSSHGEENPLVKTADNVSNVKNRRVEVIIR